jgi:hypothetical protein
MYRAVYIAIRYGIEQYINFRQFMATMVLDMPDYLLQLNIRA